MGYIYGLLIVVVYVLYEAAAVLANIELSDWTDDPDLNNLTIFPANSSQRLDRNNYYLALYGGFGAAQSKGTAFLSVCLSVSGRGKTNDIFKQQLLPGAVRGVRGRSE